MKLIEEYQIEINEDGTKIYDLVSKRLKAATPCRLGYLRVYFSRNKVRSTTSVHRLVAMAYIPNPNNLSSVNHKDGNKQNNHHSNLEWLNHKENMQHAWDTGLMENARTALRDNGKIKPKHKGMIRALKAVGYSVDDIADLMNITTVCIYVNMKNQWELSNK